MRPITIDGSGTCPHCGRGVQFVKSRRAGAPVEANGSVAWFSGNAPCGWLTDPSLPDEYMEVIVADCPLCGRPIMVLQFHRKVGAAYQQRLAYVGRRLMWPPAASRKAVPNGTPAHIASDYREASLVISDSEKASAALSRRCLQSLLREAGNTKSKDLADQIEEALPTLPGYLQQQLDAVRNIGNFAAHQQKSKATGEIVDVEPGEAEWNLDVLDLLFDFYYEQPRIAQQKRDALNKKLAEVGKPPMK